MFLSRQAGTWTWNEGLDALVQMDEMGNILRTQNERGVITETDAIVLDETSGGKIIDIDFDDDPELLKGE